MINLKLFKKMMIFVAAICFVAQSAGMEENRDIVNLVRNGYSLEQFDTLPPLEQAEILKKINESFLTRGVNFVTGVANQCGQGLVGLKNSIAQDGVRATVKHGLHTASQTVKNSPVTKYAQGCFETGLKTTKDGVRYCHAAITGHPEMVQGIAIGIGASALAYGAYKLYKMTPRQRIDFAKRVTLPAAVGIVLGTAMAGLLEISKFALKQS